MIEPATPANATALLIPTDSREGIPVRIDRLTTRFAGSPMAVMLTRTQQQPSVELPVPIGAQAAGWVARCATCDTMPEVPSDLVEELAPFSLAYLNDEVIAAVLRGYPQKMEPEKFFEIFRLADLHAAGCVAALQWRNDVVKWSASRFAEMAPHFESASQETLRSWRQAMVAHLRDIDPQDCTAELLRCLLAHQDSAAALDRADVCRFVGFCRDTSVLQDLKQWVGEQQDRHWEQLLELPAARFLSSHEALPRLRDWCRDKAKSAALRNPYLRGAAVLSNNTSLLELMTQPGLYPDLLPSVMRAMRPNLPFGEFLKFFDGGEPSRRVEAAAGKWEESLGCGEPLDEEAIEETLAGLIDGGHDEALRAMLERLPPSLESSFCPHMAALRHANFDALALLEAKFGSLSRPLPFAGSFPSRERRALLQSQAGSGECLRAVMEGDIDGFARLLGHYSRETAEGLRHTLFTEFLQLGEPELALTALGEAPLPEGFGPFYLRPVGPAWDPVVERILENYEKAPSSANAALNAGEYGDPQNLDKSVLEQAAAMGHADRVRKIFDHHGVSAGTKLSLSLNARMLVNACQGGHGDISAAHCVVDSTILNDLDRLDLYEPPLGWELSTTRSDEDRQGFASLCRLAPQCGMSWLPASNAFYRLAEQGDVEPLAIFARLGGSSVEPTVRQVMAKLFECLPTL